MKTKKPDKSQIPQLKNLWKEAFSDTNEFIDSFFSTAFSPDRCRCVTIDSEVATVLYWLDCEFDGRKIAYIYAVATAKAYRGRGLCRKAMNDVHSQLKKLGYSGAILVPGEDSLFRFYTEMGYETCCYIDEFSCVGKYNEKIEIKKIDKEVYASLRKKHLPELSVIQENENLDFLETYADFYSGKDFILCTVTQDDTLTGIEFLGERNLCESIVSSLGFKNGNFRTFGNTKPFAMFYPLEENITPPQYFSFAFD